MQVAHAGGKMDLSGHLDQSKHNNPFNLKVNIAKVDVGKLFYAFDNFGMETITDKNLKGVFSGKINVNGGIDNNGNILSKSFQGNVQFSLLDAALLNFKPFLQIQKYLFKNRNLHNVTMKSLDGQLDIDKGLISIHPMNIVTSALYLKVQGIYGIEDGTDISIEVPLRNPSKDEARIAKGLEPKRKNGLIVYLRAMDDHKGGVKISWDSRRKEVKNIDMIDL